MSSKSSFKPFASARPCALLALTAALAAVGLPLRSVADQTITTDTTLTADVSGKLTVENGASVRIGESLTVGSYAINSGTLTIAAGKTFRATDTASNYLGVDAANESSYSHTGNLGTIVLEENAVMEDTSNSGVNLFTSRLGSEARIVVGSGARFNLDWKYIKANGNTSNENRNSNNRLVLDLSGQMTVGEILTMDWFYNGGASGNPRSWPTNMVVNLHEGGTLSIRSIQNGYDTAQSVFNFDGGTLKFRWDSNFLHDGNPPAEFHFETGSRGVLNTDGHNVNLSSANSVFLSGGGAMEKSGNGTLTINPSYCDASDFTGDIYLSGGTLKFPIIADGIARKVYFQGGALSVPENGTFVTVANGGSVEFVSVDGAAIRLVSNGNAKLCPAGSAVRCSGTGSPVFEGTFAPGGEIQCGSDSDGAFGASLPAGVAYGKVGTGTDTLVVNGLSDINIHEGKLRTDKFRFYRLVFDDNAGTGNGVQVGEVLLYGNWYDGTSGYDYVSVTESGAVVSSHSTWGNTEEGASKAFNFVVGGSDKFLSFDSFSSGNADLIVEFPTPFELRAYQWYTANDCLDPADGNCRTPTAWHWLASADGENWVEVARESGFNPATSSENPDDCATNQYKVAGTWWLDYGKTHLITPLASSTITIDFGASLLVDKAESVKVGNIVGNGGAVELTQAGSVLDVGADYTTYLVGGGITGPGSVEKTGSGTARANGVNTYTGDTLVTAGTYAIVPSQTVAPKFFRFTFQNANGGAAQFAWLKLCASDGTIQSTGLTDAGVGVAAASLAPGKFSRVTDFGQWGDGNIANVFDESDDTKYGGSTGPNQVVMRLADSAKTVVSYDVMTGSDDWESLNYWGGSRRLTNFKLEASLDGNTWQTVSEVNVTDRTEVNKAWYSGTSCGYAVRHFTGTASDATIPATSTVEVKPGATLAFETSMTISKLRLDLDIAANAASPVIEGLCPAVNGTLYVVTSDADTLGKIAAKRDIPVKLNLQSLSPAAARTIRKWECKVNGVRTPYRLKAEEGADSSRLTWGSGMTIIIR